jgi:hypothetical protein
MFFLNLFFSNEKKICSTSMDEKTNPPILSGAVTNALTAITPNDTMSIESVLTDPNFSNKTFKVRVEFLSFEE